MTDTETPDNKTPDETTAPADGSTGSTRIRAGFPVKDMRKAMAALVADDSPDVAKEAIAWALRRLPEGGDGRGGRLALTEEERKARAARQLAVEGKILEFLSDSTKFMEIFPTLPDYLNSLKTSEGLIQMTHVLGYHVPKAILKDDKDSSEDELFQAAMRIRMADRTFVIRRVKGTSNYEVA